MRYRPGLLLMLTFSALITLPFVRSDSLARQSTALDNQTPGQAGKPRLEDYKISEDVLPKRARNILEHADELSVAAIKSSEWIPVKSPEDRSKLLDALYDGIANPDEAARCFIPRHKMRAIAGKESVELRICFECNNFRGNFSKEDKNDFGGPISHAPEDILTRLIQANKN